MARVGVSITKRAVFRDSTQEFSNVYHYTYTGLNPGATLAQAIVDNIVPIEKTMHSTAVTFMRARVWSAGGTVSENQMIYQGNLTGTGSLTASTVLDKERAILLQWPAGFDSRGHPVYLRKWYHSDCSAIGGVTISNPMVQNASGFSSSQRASIAALAAELDNLTVNAQSMQLCAESGRVAEGNATCHPYLEHHQLGDQWRQ